MDRVFSVEENSDPYWTAPPPAPPLTTTINFFKKLKLILYLLSSSSVTNNNEEVVEIKEPCSHRFEEYQTILKRRLEMACAAVALSRVSIICKISDFAPVAYNGSPTQASGTTQLASSQASGTTQMGSQASGKGTTWNPSLPCCVAEKSGVQIGRTTSISSREQSEDDDFDGETEITDNMDPADVKTMLSNRESARRSRRRKQAHLSELETQYNEAAVDNRILKADVETLRAKFSFAGFSSGEDGQETVKQVTGYNNPIFQAVSEISTMGIQFDSSPSDTSADAAVPTQDTIRVSNTSSDTPSVLPVEDIQNSPGTNNKMGRTSSMQRVASLEHLQKRIRGGTTTSDPHTVEWDPSWNPETPQTTNSNPKQSPV
ncbi:hypothetical protein MKW92_012972 [Papaver armeniacum]|nr:hypothetical protein MKW92_012972 [Papaver armeniacum]